MIQRIKPVIESIVNTIGKEDWFRVAKFSTNLLNMLSEFLVCEIGSKALSGITYTMLFKRNEKDMELYERYKEIREEAIRCGYQNGEVFRIYEVQNGYILDMDLSVTKRISLEISKAVANINNGQTPVKDFIGDNPEDRRKNDMIRLARYVKQEYDKGNEVIEVALFSRNSVPRILITGKTKSGESVTVKYNAYALRHWDLENINSAILIPEGTRIARMEPIEILPSKTGVSFKLYVEEI